MEFTFHESGETRWLTSPLLSTEGGPLHAFGARAAPDLAPAGAGEILAAIGRPGASPLLLNQVHGAEVARADSPEGFPMEADAVLTDQPGLAPVVRTADCVPVLLWDPDGGAAGALHAGWRGILAGVVEAGLRRMCEEYRTRPDRILAAVGPSIGACCYEVGPEVASRFAGHYLRPGFSDRPHLDLWVSVHDRLRAAGLRQRQISLARLCSSCHPEWFASHRRDGDTLHRMVSLILPTTV